MKKPLKIKLLLGATALAFFGALSRVATPGNVAQTASNNADAQLRTRYYQVSAQNLTREIEKLVPTLRTYGRSWRLIGSTTRIGVTTIACEVPVLVFADDLIITIRNKKDEKNVSVVDVRSSSRVGKSDLGENRRHILQLLRELDNMSLTPTK